MFSNFFKSISSTSRLVSQMTKIQNILLRDYRLALERNNIADLENVCIEHGDKLNVHELAIVYLYEVMANFHPDHPRKNETILRWIKIVNLANENGWLNDQFVTELFLERANALVYNSDSSSQPSEKTSASINEFDAPTEKLKFATNQSFPTETEAQNFANWIRGTSDSDVSVFEGRDGEWIVKFTETIYSKDDPSGWTRKD